MFHINKISDIGLQKFGGSFLNKLDGIKTYKHNKYDKNDDIIGGEIENYVDGRLTHIEINDDIIDDNINNDIIGGNDNIIDDDIDDNINITNMIYEGGIHPYHHGGSHPYQNHQNQQNTDTPVFENVVVEIVDKADKTSLSELRKDPVIEQAIVMTYGNTSECSFSSMNKDVCMPRQDIENIYNMTMKRHNKPTNSGKTVNEMLEELKTINNCPNESCVVNKSFQDDSAKASKIFKEYFKPIGPANSTKWLSNYDIDDVLTQIGKSPGLTSRHYYHIKFQMIDFAKTKSELANFDIMEKIAQGYRTFGAVINTDYSTGQGKHWFAIFMEYDEKNKSLSLEYFNSSGSSMMKEIADLFIDIQTKILLHKDKSQYIKGNIIYVKYNQFVLQKNSHACGVYSIAYIVLRLCGVSHEKFKYPAIINDELMGYLRNVLFLDEEKLK